MSKRIFQVRAPEAREKFQTWLVRGDAVGVFENEDLGHYNLGHLIFVPLTAEEQGRCTVGQTRGPDGQYGPGWRYLLKAVEPTLDGFKFMD
jgi:hypothetical protein